MGLPVSFRPLDAYYWPWVHAMTGAVASQQLRGIVAVRGEEPIAAAVFDGWSFNACQAHIVVDDPMVLRHGFLEEIFHYVFNTCDKGVLIGVTPGDNDKALKFNKHVGLRELYRVEDGYKVGIDYVVQELRKENCKWLRKPQSQAA